MISMEIRFEKKIHSKKGLHDFNQLKLKQSKKVLILIKTVILMI